MIPKTIHYCWISGEENMPNDISACIESWHKNLKDYKFVNWNDSNFDWDICDFTRYCRDNNLWAFCSDYVRFWAIYNFGGFYLDCDVMVYKSFDELLGLRRLITNETDVYERIRGEQMRGETQSQKIIELINKGENVQPYNRLEAAILGGEKGDSFFNRMKNFYTSTTMKPLNVETIIAPDVMQLCVEKCGYTLHHIENIIDEIKDDSTINVLDVNTYFNRERLTDYTIAAHLFKNSWLK